MKLILFVIADPFVICIEILWYYICPDITCGALMYVVSLIDIVGEDAAIKLIARETLMKEREERLKVFLT